jgi:hypothetical protein
MTMIDPVPDDSSRGRSPDSLRREVDREIVRLLRQNQRDNQQIIAHLAAVVGLLEQQARKADGHPALSCHETGLWPALAEEN